LSFEGGILDFVGMAFQDELAMSGADFGRLCILGDAEDLVGIRR
jgi:hypothetical protein